MKSSSLSCWRNFLLWSCLLTAAWLILWFAPWQAWLSPFIWIRLGLAFIIFIIPGICIYGLVKQDNSWLNYLTFGFVISHLLIGVLGTLGKLIHFSFGFLQFAYMFLSLILLLIYAVPRIGATRVRFRPQALKDLISYWPLMLIALLAVLISIQRVITDDDLIHLGYITQWQHAAALDFNDVFYGVDQLASARFWLASTLFGHAFLAAASHIPPIFISGGFYEPFLVLLALASAYKLAQTLGLSRSKAMASVALQIAFLVLLSESLHPGARFFMGLSVDKGMSTFILIPVFLQSVIWYFDRPATQNLILVGLTGASLMLMHPIALAFAVFVAGSMAAFGINRENARGRAIFLIILIIIMLPQLALRFVNTGAQSITPYSADDIQRFPGTEALVSRWDNTDLYGYNPSILGMHIPYSDRIPINELLLKFAWLIFPILAALVAVVHLREDHLSQYVLAAFLLAALAGIPFTGWILGRIVGAWQLERTLWSFPFGIATIFALVAFSSMTGISSRLKKWGRALQSATKMDLSHWPSAGLVVFSAVLLILFMREQGLPNIARLEANSARFAVFTHIGQFMDSHASGLSFAVGTDELNDYIPGISSKVNVIYFRPSDTSLPAYFYSPQERAQRKADRESIFTKTVSAEDRVQLLRKYHIQFLWLRAGEYALVKRMLNMFPDLFTQYQIGEYYVIEVH